MRESEEEGGGRKAGGISLEGNERSKIRVKRKVLVSGEQRGVQGSTGALLHVHSCIQNPRGYLRDDPYRAPHNRLLIPEKRIFRD